MNEQDRVNLAHTIQLVQGELHHLGRIRDHALSQATKAEEMLGRKTFAAKGPDKVRRMQKRLTTHRDTARSVIAEMNTLQTQFETLVARYDGKAEEGGQ